MNTVVRRTIAVFQMAFVTLSGFVTFNVSAPDVVSYSQAAPRGVARRTARRVVRRHERRENRREARQERRTDRREQSAESAPTPQSE